MPQKIAGIGLTNIILLWAVFVLLTVGAKVLVNKYPVKGLTEIITAV